MNYTIFYDQTNQCIVGVPDHFSTHIKNSNMKMAPLFTGDPMECEKFVNGMKAFMEAARQQKIAPVDVLIDQALKSNPN